MYAIRSYYDEDIDPVDSVLSELRGSLPVDLEQQVPASRTCLLESTTGFV